MLNILCKGSVHYLGYLDMTIFVVHTFYSTWIIKSRTIPQ